MDTGGTKSEFFELLEGEIILSASRSSGPGGQHVNKVSTKIELRFNIPASDILSDEQKEILLNKLKNKITIDGDLVVTSQATRSQVKNREKAIDKFKMLIENALKPTKKRKPTKPTKAAREKRLETKKKLSEKKELRRPPEH